MLFLDNFTLMLTGSILYCPGKSAAEPSKRALPVTRPSKLGARWVCSAVLRFCPLEDFSFLMFLKVRLEKVLS